MTHARLVAFGEAMLRLTAPAGGAIESADVFRGSVGGAELNAAIAAVRSGMPATWVSALPGNPLGRLVLRHARAGGVDVVSAAPEGADPARLGLYFLEMPARPRPGRITYDRRGSAFAHLDPTSLRWEDLVAADTCLYVTGITPPLGSGPRKAMDDAITTARRVGGAVALDANYRQTLWPREEFAAWLASALPEADFVAASAEDLRDAGIGGDDPLAEALERFGLQALVTSDKERVGGDVRIRIRVLTPSGEHRADAVTSVVDQIGAGDAMFGTFLAVLPDGGAAAATERALGAAVTCYGLFGDALVADPWDGAETRGVVR